MLVDAYAEAAPGTRPGLILFVQTFGDLANFNPHVHVLAADGAFLPDATFVRIPDWRAAGYSVRLIYLRLPSADASVARVAKRVALGGHDIPQRDIRRRFARSLDYFETRYKPIVDEWYMWESLEDEEPRLIAAWDKP